MIIMTINIWSPSINTLKFGSIRTSLMNILTGKDKNIAYTFIDIISEISKREDWEYIEIAFTPMGPMQGVLNSYNFILNPHGKPKYIKSNEIKAKNSDNFRSLLQDNQEIYEDKCDMYKVLKKTYPNREINDSVIDELRNILIEYEKYNPRNHL